jgi:CheY-like chemotaxis protein
MRLLVVEDDTTFLEGVVPLLRSLGDNVEITEAHSKAVAQASLEDRFFDLVLLDLTIPTSDGLLDLNILHGYSVFAQAQLVANGTPVFILTGSSAENLFPDLIARAQQVDVWGDGVRRPTIDYLPKSQLDKLRDKLKPIYDAVQALDDVEVKRSGGGKPLSIPEDRLVRIFVRTRAGSRCELAQMGAGLSESRVFRVKVFDPSGATRIDAIAKVGTHDAVGAEIKSYEKEISRLDPKATPRCLGILNFGGKGTAGVFYGLAEGYESTLFDLLGSNVPLATSVVGRVAELTRKWNEGVPERLVRVLDVRRLFIPDDKASRVCEEFNLQSLKAFEQRKVKTRWSCVHGDLHGGNLLVNSEGIPVIIDYGDVKEGPGAIDPVTLELSVLFHPDRPKASGWPSALQAQAWGDVTSYADNCQFADFVKACRSWSEKVGVGPREISACAYGYVLRQLKYPDSDKDLLMNLLTGIQATFQNA